MKKIDKVREGTFRMGKCPHTKKLTRQVWTGKEWLCLHK